MSLLTTTQTKIENKIFTKLGSTVTRTPVSDESPTTFGDTGLAFPISFAAAISGSSIDKWGDITLIYGDDESVTAVPYSYKSKEELFEMFGDVEAGYTTMAFKYNQDLNMSDKITYDSKTLIIKDIEKFPLQDGNLLKIALLYEDITA